MECVDVEVGLRIRLCLAHVAQDRLDVGERLLVERSDIAVEAAPVRIREQRFHLGHRGDERRIDSETAGDRVALHHLARRRGMRENPVAQLFELLPRQELLAENEAVAIECGAILWRDKVRKPRPAAPGHGMRELRAPRMQAAAVQLRPSR